MALNNNYMWSNNNNPYIPNSYNNYMNQSPYISNTQIPRQQQVSQNNIIWVKGKENARSMQVPPNSTVILLDSEVGKFYIKTTDDIGLGKLRIFSYIEEPDEDKTSNVTSSTVSSNIDLSNYVTKTELQEIIKEIRTENNEHVIPIVESNSTATKKQQLTTINKQF